ncbi:DUF6778 family protein [Pseudorhodobacter sp.]|uniref:DUF6778 family protein n=1 Tax=Pseudorhodobacter sp. TaxID=1934400 RepID=UPI0026480E91|nr:DUF6778 family protein [Pseudorhodobacter sp.]MDN5787423.1 hypothetical protein [Pseudorhodobacter sp.]
MRTFRLVPLLGVAFGIAACAAPDVASRNGFADSSPVTDYAMRQTALAPQYDVKSLRVAVPEKLRAAENRGLFIQPDILWRGEPAGERHGQIAAMFTEALKTAVAQMTTGPEVVIEAEVTRFRGLDDTARQHGGGRYDIAYLLTVRDYRTGQVVDGPRLVKQTITEPMPNAARAENERSFVVIALRNRARRELSAEFDNARSSRNTGPIALTPGRLMEQSPLPL